ncbi:hypothetical protein Tco_0667441, partial [Tanacetum coccineum]
MGTKSRLLNKETRGRKNTFYDPSKEAGQRTISDNVRRRRSWFRVYVKRLMTSLPEGRIAWGGLEDVSSGESADTWAHKSASRMSKLDRMADNTSFWKDKWHNEGVLKMYSPSRLWLREMVKLSLKANHHEAWKIKIDGLPTRQKLSLRCIEIDLDSDDDFLLLCFCEPRFTDNLYIGVAATAIPWLQPYTVFRVALTSADLSLINLTEPLLPFSSEQPVYRLPTPNPFEAANLFGMSDAAGQMNPS